MQHELGRRENRIGYWWESQKEKDRYEDQDVGGCTIMKMILQKHDEVAWSGLM
jgi:hypothetical protein